MNDLNLNLPSHSPFGIEDTTTFTDKNHPQELLKYLCDFHQQKLYCDVKIKVEDKVFSCHRSVLAAGIPYFRSMFRSGMNECTQSEIVIRDICSDSFATIVDFLYTSTLNISTSNVQRLLYASSILQMDSVCQACERFLTQYLTVANCLSIRQFAQQHNCTTLMESIDNFTAENFQEIRKLPEFLHISNSHLFDLLNRSDLFVESEEEVFETAIRWIDQEAPSRRQHLANLLSTVRLAQLSTEYLLEVVKRNPLVQEDPNCKDLVSDAMGEKMLFSHAIYELAYRPIGQSASGSRRAKQPAVATNSLEDAFGCGPLKVSPPSPVAPAKISRPRKSAAGVIFCVGGRGTSGDPFRTVEAYDWRQDKWIPVTEMGIKRRHVGVVSAFRKLYAIGGHDGHDHLDSAECFDPADSHWRPVASMDTRRRGIAVGALEGAIYAVGGLDDTTCFQTVERYDIEADRWSSVAPMNVQRGGVGVASLGKYLYAVGGNDGTSSLDSCERYDPHLNKWTLVAPMAHRRAGAGVTLLDGCLYAIGGFDDNAPLNSCERYNPTENTWVMLPPMSCPRGGVGVAAMGGRIYAVGGHDGVRYLDSVEAFDPLTNEWSTVASISQCRAGAGVAWCETTVTQLQRQAVNSGCHPNGSGGGVAYCV